MKHSQGISEITMHYHLNLIMIPGDYIKHLAI